MQIIECPRDAMQGLGHFVPTEMKIAYLNTLLQVGFHTLDFGSFVSPKAIPNLRDTAQVLQGLNLSGTDTRLLAIVANERGASEASTQEAIAYLGYPLSASETFQRRNTNKSVGEALEELRRIQDLCAKSGKTLVVYISMGFGNPYGDPYSAAHIGQLVQELAAIQVEIISFADTVGVATPAQISNLYSRIVPGFPEITFGVHLHARPGEAPAKLEAAYQAGCRRFDGAMRGFGGCPFAEDELTGNMPTEAIVHFLDAQGVETGLDRAVFAQAWEEAALVFEH